MKQLSVKLLKIILQVFFLYLLSVVGGLIVKVTQLPLPGSIIGLILLLIMLHMKIVPKQFVQDGAGFLLSLLTLLFIPATVGVVNYPELLSWFGVSLLFITIVSTLFALAVTAKFAQSAEKKELRNREGKENASSH